MIVPRNSSDTKLDARYSLDLEYETAAPGPGKLLVRTYDATDLREGTLRLDPWSPSGYFIALWSSASALLLGGADRMVMLDLERLAVQSSILFEYQEYDTLDEPRVASSDDLCVVASISRVTCFDRRLASRWSWSVRVMSRDWTQIVNVPSIGADNIRVPVRTHTKDFHVVLAQADGTNVP